jgi:hypothetical protein
MRSRGGRDENMHLAPTGRRETAQDWCQKRGQTFACQTRSPDAIVIALVHGFAVLVMSVATNGDDEVRPMRPDAPLQRLIPSAPTVKRGTENGRSNYV